MVAECEECQNCLRLLGITQPPTDEQLKAAYRDYVRVWHPDRFDTDARLRERAEEETKRINAAYDHLCTHKESEPRRTEEPIPCYEPTEGPDAEPWQEVNPKDEPEASQRVENHGMRSKSDRPAWRWVKVCLRAVWRVFTIALMLSVGALLLLYLVFKAIKYFDSRDRRHKGDLSASLNAWVTELYVAEFLGLPLLAVRGLMFLSAVTLVGVGFAGSMLWSLLAPHPLLIICFAVVASLGCICWALMAEYNFEFVVAHSTGNPRTAAWVMGLIVTLGSLGITAYAVTKASSSNSSHMSGMPVTSTSVDSTVAKEASPSPVVPASSVVNESAPISNTQPNVSPTDITPQSVQDPKESERQHAEGLRMSSGARPNDEVAVNQDAPKPQAEQPAPTAGRGTIQSTTNAALTRETSQASSGQEGSSYADILQRRIQGSWLQYARQSQIPKGMHIVVAFTISENAHYYTDKDVEIVKSSGISYVDRDCKYAVLSALSFKQPSSAINNHFTASCDY